MAAVANLMAKEPGPTADLYTPPDLLIPLETGQRHWDWARRLPPTQGPVQIVGPAVWVAIAVWSSDPVFPG